MENKHKAELAEYLSEWLKIDSKKVLSLLDRYETDTGKKIMAFKLNQVESETYHSFVTDLANKLDNIKEKVEENKQAIVRHQNKEGYSFWSMSVENLLDDILKIIKGK